MGKFRCLCGEVMSELNTDFMSTRGHLIPDQDLEEVFYDATDAQREEVAHRCRTIWQCPDCGALHVSDGVGRWSFAPVDPDTPRHLLTSVFGAAWRGPMGGNWRPSVTDGPKGELWWDDGNPDMSGWEHFDNPDDLTRRYHEVFQDRHARGVVRSSFLRIDGTIVHQWPPPTADDATPAEDGNV